MKNVKLGVKLVGGFSAVALIVLIVGLVGWQGAASVNEHVTEIGFERMPGLENLLFIKVESNAMRIALRSLLNPRMSLQDRNRQYQNIEQSRTNVRAAWQVYDALPKTDEEARIWREFAAAWNAWEELNNRFLENSRSVERTDVLNPDAYEAMLTGFVVDHHELMSRVNASLLGGSTFAGGDDPTACNFGRWMAGYRTTNPDITRILQELPRSHNVFHASVATIRTHVQNGNNAAALQVYREQMEPNARRTFELFNELLVEAERVVQLYDALSVQALTVAV